MPHSVTPTSGLAKAQDALSAALEAFDATCRRLDVQYILVAGSLLGAVRHSGFIPWDDDIDVAMTCDQFDRFVENAAPTLGGRFVVHTRRDDPILGADAKIYVNGTRAASAFGEVHSMQRPLHPGVFIDIFVLYPVSKHWLIEMLEKVAGWLVYVHPWAASLARSPALPMVKRVRWMMVAAIHERLVRAVGGWLRNCAKTRDSGVWGIGWGAINGRGIFATETLFPPSEGQFNGIAVPLPADAHRALSQTYGPDYMTPPPDALRVGHAATIAFEEN